MSGKGRYLGDAVELRRQAEAISKSDGDQFNIGADFLSPEESRWTTHELLVHKIELEIQNEELRRVQLELDASRSRYFELYDQAPVGYLTLTKLGLIQEANQTIAQMLGVECGNLAQQSITRYILLEDQDIYYMHRKKLTESGVAQACELRMRKMDGRIFWALFEASVVSVAAKFPGVLGGDGQQYRLVVSDITTRKLSEIEGRKLHEQMNQVQKLEALGVLVAGVAHNMNNVLTAIMGAASWRERGAGDPADLEAYRIIGAACKRGRDVVKSLMQFARPSLASQHPLEVHGLITEVLVLLENVTRNRVDLREKFVGDPLWILGDASSLNTALMNICLNAIDAMPEGGRLTIQTSIPEEGWVEVAIEDNGTGMAPEVLARVHEPFFTTKPVGKGTGLGLSMTHGVIKAHGGEMVIESCLDRGTMVRLRIPCILTPDAPPSVAAPAPVLGAKRVLLVDDDPDVRFLVTRMLQSEGFEVDSASGGQECLEKLRKGLDPDFIILDQNMPGMDGVETLKKLRGRGVNCPVLVASGQPDIQDWACFQQPNVGVLAKPFDSAEMIAKLKLLTAGSPQL